ncbi:S-layer homology domain-containing protein [Cohnella soli]|uniref:S-layer homology domain-containing protein n=1 Tax=Cohnella soli TaxID=425005 RepID=A0ABW0HTA2_9BACL
MEGNPGIIDNVNHTIEVKVPYRSAVDRMQEIFEVSEGAIVLNHTSESTRTDYSSPKTLTVQAEDGSQQVYTVTVTIGPSNVKSFRSFNLTAPAVTGLIDEEVYAIFLMVPYSTDVTSLKPVFTLDDSAAIVKVGSSVQTSGVSSQNFTTPVTYTVTALDGSTRDYIVTVTRRDPSTAKKMTSFGLVSPNSFGIINESSHTISITVPYDTTITSLVPTFTSTGTKVTAGGPQPQLVSGEGAFDFSQSVDFSVYDEAGFYQIYTVTVTAAAQDAETTKQIQTFSIGGVDGSVDEVAHTISIALPGWISRNSMTASFTTNGKSVWIGDQAQTSGVTLNDFIAPVTYTVVAVNGVAQNYTVTVTTLSPAKELTSFSFANPQSRGIVNQTKHTVALTVPYGTNITALAPSFAITGAKVMVGAQVQVSGVTQQDFTNPVTYSVYAEDGTKQDYTVTVTVASPPIVTGPVPETPSKPKPPVEVFARAIDVAKIEEIIKAEIEKVKTNPVSTSFSDVNNHWSKPSIDILVKLGVVSGYKDGSFRPNANITRAEFSAIIARVFHIETTNNTSPLKDVQNHWANSAILALASNGIISGYGDGTFKPDKTISRAEIIAILSHIVDLAALEKKQNISFNDISGAWNAQEINAAAASGLVEGRDASTFAPNETSTRAEALTIILRALNLNPAIKQLLDQLKA